MFNSPLLDVAIGLVFIFLLYSLLATSVNEAIATVFGLRARMLKNGIVESMLANTANDNRWMSLLKGIKELFLEIWKMFAGKREKPEAEKKIGDKFFDHPLIKNYGSSRIFPTPSYIPASNFSTVLIDLLKKEFDARLSDIAQYKLSLSTGTDTLVDVEQTLQYSADVVKIKEVLDYYGRHYATSDTPPPFSIIDKDTWNILQLHLRESVYNIAKFTTSIEGWFDDSMKRVSGWYKRQTQIVLFLIGIALAITFNVDTIELSGRLSTDKDARDKLVQMAEQATEKYKDDPRVKKMEDAHGNIMPDTSKASRDSNDVIFKQYQLQSDSIKKFVQNEIAKANDIVALGWGDYGMKKNGDKKIECYKKEYEKWYDSALRKIDADKKAMLFATAGNAKQAANSNDTSHTPKDLQDAKKLALTYLYNDHWFALKVGYVFNESTNGRRILGFLLTAFAICMGAPFWFDLLNKLVHLRATGKKEDTSSAADSSAQANNAAPQPPITLNVNTQTTGEEAVG